MTINTQPDRTLEAILFGAAFAETQLLQRPLRHAKIHLPLPQGLETFYYQNFGDFLEGCYIPCITDITLTYAMKIFTKKEYHHAINIASGIIAISAIAAEEMLGIFSTPDIKDIPAGIAGVLAYMACRYCSIKKYENINNGLLKPGTDATPSF